MTITAGKGGRSRLALGTVINTAVDVGDQIGLTTGAGVPLASVPTPFTQLVRRLDAAKPVTVLLTIADGCGDWQTVVGGGPTAF